MQYSITVYGTFKTYNVSGIKARRNDDTNYSYQQYAERRLKLEAKGLMSSIKLELYLDGKLVKTTYGTYK